MRKAITTLFSAAMIMTACENVSDGLEIKIFDDSQRCWYFNAETGNDANDGASPDRPLKSLYMLTYADLKPGDVIYLAENVTHRGGIDLKGVSGDPENPIIITSYGSGNGYAHIDARGKKAGISMQDCSNITVDHISISANASGGLSDTEARNLGMRCGIIFIASEGGRTYSGIAINDVKISNVFMEETGYVRDPDDTETANGEGQYGFGIHFQCTNPSTAIDNVTVSDCEVSDVSHTGIRFTGRPQDWSITNINVSECKVYRTGGPGIQMSGVRNVVVEHNTIDQSGYTGDTRNWKRGSGYWCFGSDKVLFQYNRMTNANGPADSAGAHIDYNNSNVIYQYNFSANNYGGFIEILGDNYNCCYRYNVSVNDGQRPSTGHTMTVSGYNGSDPSGPFHTYIYNNTIYVSSECKSSISFTSTADGLLIANNIFCVEGTTEYGQTTGSTPPTNTLMENNLFLTANSWPSASNVNDSAPLYGDPLFANKGGLDIEDYVPRAEDMVKDKGIEIPFIEGDDIGLWLGLPVAKDILGNPVDSAKPDMGAIEIQ